LSNFYFFAVLLLFAAFVLFFKSYSITVVCLLYINLEILTLVSIGAADISETKMSAAPMLISVRISKFMHNERLRSKTVRCTQPCACDTTHPYQLSLAIPVWFGAMSTSKSWGANTHHAMHCTGPVPRAC